MKRIRRATETELPEVARIFREAISTAEWLPEPAREFTDFGKASEGEDVFVYYDECVRGFVSVQSTDSYIHHLFVDQRFKHQGVGTALLDSLQEWMPFPWTLKCVDSNTEALAFYEALGWKKIGSGGGKHGNYTTLEYKGE